MFSKNSEISNFMKIRPVGAELFHTDGQTADMMKLFTILQTRVKTCVVEFGIRYINSYLVT